MEFEKICMLFTMQEPFYGILLSSMQRVPKNTGTLSVSRRGNVFQLNYNPDFVSKLSIETTLEALKHEVLHLAFNHFSLWETEPDSMQEREFRNYAADLEVNCYLNLDKFKDIHPITVSEFGWEKHLGAREYYRKLLELAEQMQQQQQQQQMASQPQQPCNGGQGDSQQQNNKSQQSQQNQQSQGNSSNQNQPSQGQQQGNSSQETQQKMLDNFEKKYSSIDSHDEWPDEDEQTCQDMNQIVNDLLDFAAAEVEKGRGTIPGELKGRIESIRNKKRPRPAADWKRYFRRYMGHEFTELIRKSKKRESKRFPDAAGNRHQRKSHILVGIDTSGSVSMPEYIEFMQQIQTLTKSATFHVIECDADIQHEYDYNGHIPEILHGGGGTDFQPVIDVFNKNRRKYDALVYFTDGCCPVPKDTPKETLWVISSEGVGDRKPFLKNGASCVLIPPKKQ